MLKDRLFVLALWVFNFSLFMFATLVLNLIIEFAVRVLNF